MENHGNKLKCIPFSTNTVGRCIENIAEGLKKQIEKVKQCKQFALELAENRYF